VSEQWEDGIKGAIEYALPPLAHYDSPDRMGNILTSLLSGDMECWTVWKGEDICIIATLQVLLDNASGVRSLLIYSIYAYINITINMWGTLVKFLSTLAREQNCNRIVAYTNVERVKEIIRSVGGDTSYSFISLEV
jgi:hypothetical protein